MFIIRSYVQQKGSDNSKILPKRNWHHYHFRFVMQRLISFWKRFSEAFVEFFTITCHALQ